MSVNKTAMYHIEWVKTEEFKDVLFPVVYFFDGSVSRSLHLFFKSNYELGRGKTHEVRNLILAVSEIYEFFMKMESRHEQWALKPARLLIDYFYTRMHGTITDGTCEVGLWWKPLKYNVVKKRIVAFEVYEQFCTQFLGANSFEVADVLGRNTGEYINWKKNNTFSLLTHLNGDKTNSKPDKGGLFKPRITHESAPGQGFKYLPPEALLKMVDETDNINYKACILLQCFTALRGSEALHILINDITPEGIILSHPVGGKTYCQSKKQLIPRSAVFEKYQNQHFSKEGLSEIDILYLSKPSPRVDLVGGEAAYKLQWKGVTLKHQGSFGYTLDWSSEEARVKFKNLLFELIRQKRLNHPYLLCQKGSGTPLKIGTYSQYVRRKIKELTGITGGPHMLRHFAGMYCVNGLGLSLDDVQVFMRHARRSSTEIYAHATGEKMRSSLAGTHSETEFVKLKKQIKENWQCI